MEATILKGRDMQKLAVFSLPAVIRYDKELLRSYFVDAINSVEGTGFSLSDVPETGNASQVVMNLFEQELGAFPSIKKMERISKKFTKRVKKYFIDEDDSFEVRPGVQSIFRQIEKEKKWRYCIISDYWADSTHLMLQTCGVFSKNKFTITADDALTQEDQLKMAVKRAHKKNKGLKTYYINGTANEADTNLAIVLKPKFSAKTDNYFAYPKFSELFKKSKD